MAQFYLEVIGHRIANRHVQARTRTIYIVEAKDRESARHRARTHHATAYAGDLVTEVVVLSNGTG